MCLTAGPSYKVWPPGVGASGMGGVPANLDRACARRQSAAIPERTRLRVFARLSTQKADGRLLRALQRGVDLEWRAEGVHFPRPRVQLVRDDVEIVLGQS